MGASVVVASRKADACAETEAALTASGHAALGVSTHMGDLDAVEQLVARTVDRFGAIDIVVNNAALGLALPLGELTPDAWQKVFDVNVRGPVFLAQAALPHLRASSHAAVVNVLSAGVFMALPDNAMYGAAKSALLSFTRSMAAAWAPDGIRVNGLIPGSTDTDMLRGASEARRTELVAGSMLGRAAQPAEMVGPAVFLASDASSYMTGQVLMADGGLAPH
jgi:NAD(P)-dependent dehydrogenase (short-subunit alcohol dehydrogenase family)